MRGDFPYFVCPFVRLDFISARFLTALQHLRTVGGAEDMFVNCDSG